MTVHKEELNEDDCQIISRIPGFSECHKDNAEAKVTQISYWLWLSDLIIWLSFTSDRTDGTGSRKQGDQLTELSCQSCFKEPLDSRASELQHENAKVVCAVLLGMDEVIGLFCSYSQMNRC